MLWDSFDCGVVLWVKTRIKDLLSSFQAIYTYSIVCLKCSSHPKNSLFLFDSASMQCDSGIISKVFLILMKRRESTEIKIFPTLDHFQGYKLPVRHPLHMLQFIKSYETSKSLSGWGNKASGSSVEEIILPDALLLYCVASKFTK